tara:strand:+ start:1960 stop:2421 length:462 start_codon:yes stop_codon:yes gene_type:complete
MFDTMLVIVSVSKGMFRYFLMLPEPDLQEERKTSGGLIDPGDAIKGPGYVDSQFRSPIKGPGYVDSQFRSPELQYLFDLHTYGSDVMDRLQEQRDLQAQEKRLDEEKKQKAAGEMAEAWRQLRRKYSVMYESGKVLAEVNGKYWDKLGPDVKD